MSLIRVLCAGFVASFLLAGCGSPRLDASSEAALDRSLLEIRSSIAAEKRLEFEGAIEAVAEGAGDREGAWRELSVLHGMNASEIVGFAASMRASEIEELERKERLAQAYERELARLNVDDARIIESRSQDGRPRFELEGVLRNGSSKAVLGVDLDVTVRTAGRPYAWANVTCEIWIAGGVGPGEIVSFRSGCPAAIDGLSILRARVAETRGVAMEVDQEGSGLELQPLAAALESRAGASIAIEVVDSVGELNRSYQGRLNSDGARRLGQLRSPGTADRVGQGSGP